MNWAAQESQDEQLVQRCRDRDPEAQTELRQRLHAGILRTIRRDLVRYRASPDLGEDIAATFWYDLFYRKLWRLRAYRPERGCLEGYLTGIARLSVLDFLDQERRQKPVTLPLAELDLIARPAEETAVREALEHLCGNLSNGDRALLLSHLRSEPIPHDTPSSGPEAIREAACLRQRKKRLLHKVLHILGLRNMPKKS